MNLRSWLFVPGDSERKLDKADAATPDAVVLDLEDSVAASAKARARQQVSAYLKARPRAARRAQLWVRINPLDDAARLDLAAIVGGDPDGVVIPKVDGPADVVRASHYLDALETREGLTEGSVRIVPVVTETAAAPFALGGYAAARLARLEGMIWGAEDLSAAVGATTNRDASGELAFTYRWARAAALLAAKACGVQAIETLYADFRDATGLERASRAAAQEGFTGRVAIHPDQVAPIHDAFAPSADDVRFARSVVEAFRAQPGAGTVALGGKMLDIPHLKQAEHTLEAHAASSRGKDVTS